MLGPKDRPVARGKRRTGPGAGPVRRDRASSGIYLTARDFTARDFTARDFTARDFTARDFVTRVAALFAELVAALAVGLFGVTFLAGIPITSSLMEIRFVAHPAADRSACRCRTSPRRGAVGHRVASDRRYILRVTEDTSRM